MKIYLLYHIQDLDNDQDFKLLGVYSTKERAEDRIEKAKKLKGFCDYPDGFQIEGMEVDKDEWIEGFIMAVPDKNGYITELKKEN